MLEFLLAGLVAVIVVGIVVERATVKEANIPLELEVKDFKVIEAIKGEDKYLIKIQENVGNDWIEIPENRTEIIGIKKYEEMHIEKIEKTRYYTQKRLLKEDISLFRIKVEYKLYLREDQMQTMKEI